MFYAPRNWGTAQNYLFGVAVLLKWLIPFVGKEYQTPSTSLLKGELPKMLDIITFVAGATMGALGAFYASTQVVAQLRSDLDGQGKELEFVYNQYDALQFQETQLEDERRISRNLRDRNQALVAEVFRLRGQYNELFGSLSRAIEARNAAQRACARLRKQLKRRNKTATSVVRQSEDCSPTLGGNR